MKEFVAKGTPLSEESLAAACDRLRVDLPAIWSVLKVETRGCGFLSDRRPQILFERHVFHHETNGRYDAVAPEISDPHPGGYGVGGAHQYDRLARAIELDRQAALRSTSWGIGQVMGRNAEMVGFANVEAMVKRMTASEDGQLEGMVGYLTATNLDTAMREGNWQRVARVYNGQNYAENAYDHKLHDAYVGFSLNGTPDVGIRRRQMQLLYGGFSPGPIDGAMGNRTREAVKRFQTASGLPVTGALDPATIAKLDQLDDPA